MVPMAQSTTGVEHGTGESTLVTCSSGGRPVARRTPVAAKSPWLTTVYVATIGSPPTYPGCGAIDSVTATSGATPTMTFLVLVSSVGSRSGRVPVTVAVTGWVPTVLPRSRTM